MDDNYQYPSMTPEGARLPNQTKFHGKLIITTCFYQAQSNSRYTQAMVATAGTLERLGVKWEFWPVHGDFHIERAANGALAKFMADPEATDILMIDSDEAWDVMAVMRLIASPHDVIACAYRMKNNWEKYTCALKWREDGVLDGYVGPDGKAVIRAERIPAGFLRLRKPPLEKFAESLPEDQFYMDGDLRVPMFFHAAVRDHQFFSQDFEFSERMKALGVELWIDPNGLVDHYGLTEYKGNLDAHLKGAAKAEKDRKTFEVVKGMAAEIEGRANASRAAA